MNARIPDDPDDLQADMEAERIRFERWRQIHRPARMMIDDYPDKYEGLKRDAQRERDEELGGDDA